MPMDFDIEAKNITQLGLKHKQLKMKTKAANVSFLNTFYCCQFNTSNQIENRATVKSVWKN